LEGNRCYRFCELPDKVVIGGGVHNAAVARREVHAPSLLQQAAIEEVVQAAHPPRLFILLQALQVIPQLLLLTCRQSVTDSAVITRWIQFMKVPSPPPPPSSAAAPPPAGLWRAVTVSTVIANWCMLTPTPSHPKHVDVRLPASTALHCPLSCLLTHLPQPQHCPKLLFSSPSSPLPLFPFMPLAQGHATCSNNMYRTLG